LLLFAATIALALKFAWTSGGGDTVILALGAGLTGGLTAQQFSSPTVPTALLLYLFVALITREASPSVASRFGIGNRSLAVAARNQDFQAQGISLSVIPPKYMRVIAAAIAIIFFGFAAQLAITDRELALTQNSLVRSDLRGTLLHYGHAERWHPAGSSADLFASRELANFFRRTADVRLKLQSWTPAFQAAVRAVSASEERQNAFYNLAIFFATQNDATSMERSLRNAIYWAPNWFKPHWALAKLYLQAGKLPEAESEARTAMELNGGRNDEVAQTLTAVRARLVAKN
jgi:hypothetical protein